MDKLTRIRKIEEIVNRDKNKPFGMVEIPWEDKLESMAVYKIPLSYLVYNKYNGRILSRTKSLEKQNHTIDVESPEGKKVIEKLLWESKEDRNKKTQTDLENFGQKKVGIITRDGIIIDGNRRAMLLTRSGKVDYFKAVVLPVNGDENLIEIQKLETSFQMGEDEKLGYNPIEKYLKARDLYEILRPTNEESKVIAKIADWMGEQKGTIEDYLQIMKTMDEYLDEYGYSGIYTQLDKREDQFINLTKWLNAFYGEQSLKAFENYKDSDVDDLKIVAFDHIRAKYEGKEFRILAEGQRANHLFGNKEIWVSFRDRHFHSVEKLIESNIDYDSQDLESHLNDRDNKYSESVLPAFVENIEHHDRLLKNKQAEDQPERLIGRAIDTFKAVNQKHPSFAKENVQTKLAELTSFAIKSLDKKSPIKVLSLIQELFNDFKIDQITDDNIEEARNLARHIQHQLNVLRDQLN